MSNVVLEEAKRCLKCKRPLCKEGCPISTPVNEVMAMLLEGNIVEAGEKLFENNPLSVICSVVCPHGKQCEGHCILGRKGTPIKVGMVENYISSYYLDLISTKKEKSENKKVAIIGSGPAGITMAILLADKGYDITIFEAHDKIGGVLRYGIPGFRLPKDILDKIKDKLVDMGVKIRPNTLIGPSITIDDLFTDGYEAIFIGTGVWKPKKLGIKGESLGNVHYSIDYLKSPEVYDLGDKVCVIGAGNVAMDAARTAIRQGAKEVSVMYRRGEVSMDAEIEEIEYAKLDGVRFEYYKAPLEFLDNGVRYIKTEVTDIMESGKENVRSIEGSEDIFKADSIILAIGQDPKDNIISSTNGIEVSSRGLIHANEAGETTRDGVFASGDVVTGAKTVVQAVKLSKNVAEAIDKYLKNK